MLIESFVVLTQSVVTAFASVAGNFIYARFYSRNYRKAFETSFFQVIAIVLLCFFLMFGV